MATKNSSNHHQTYDVNNKRAEHLEYRNVIKLGKIIAFICGCLSQLLIIIAIATTSWLLTEDYRQGLWEECFMIDEGNGNESMQCVKNPKTDWIIACAVLCIIAMLGDLGGVVLNLIGLIAKDPTAKKNFYRAAMYILFVAIACLVIGLIVFPAMFMQEVDGRGYGVQWYFGWSYGVAWGSAIFMFGAAILLLVDRENDTIYYREKTYYNGPETDA